MNLEDQKIEAMVECLLLWNLIAETGLTKQQAITRLWKEGKIRKLNYSNDCPLCEVFLFSSKGRCFHCPIPGRETYRCEKTTPYRGFCRGFCCASDDNKKRKEKAKEFFQYLLNLNF